MGAGDIYFWWQSLLLRLMVPVCIQLLHILPDYVKRESDICSLSFVPLQGVYVLDFISYSSKYLSPPDIPLNWSHGEWTLAIHRLNAHGFDKTQETWQVPDLQVFEAHDANTESLRPIWVEKNHEALGAPHQPLFLNISMSVVLGLSSGIQSPHWRFEWGYLNASLHSTDLCGKLYTIVTFVRVVNRLQVWPLQLGIIPKSTGFIVKFWEIDGWQTQLGLLSWLSTQMEIQLSVQFNCPQVFLSQNVKGGFQFQMLQAKALRRNMSQFELHLYNRQSGDVEENWNGQLLFIRHCAYTVTSYFTRLRPESRCQTNIGFLFSV